jgi:hypothetical protein
MPNVAICYWGLCRSTHLTIDSIKQNIYDVLTENGFTYTVYLHTFVINRLYQNKRSQEPPLKLDNDLYKLLNPDHYLVEDQDVADLSIQFKSYRAYGDPWNSNFETFDNHIRSLYSLNKVTELYKDKKAAYDYVIYLRPDVLFLNKLEPKWFDFIKDNKTLLAPDYHLDLPMNDRFCIAKPDAAIFYGTRYGLALDYSWKKPLHSERFLYDVLSKNHIDVLDIPLRFRRVRATGKTIDDGTHAPAMNYRS